MIQLYNTAVAQSKNFPYSSVSPSRTQPGPLRHAVLVHGVQLPVSKFSSAIWSLGWLPYHFMHVREVNPVVNSISLYSLECKSPHWQNSKLAPNSLKVSCPSRESNPSISGAVESNTYQAPLIVLMAVYPAQKHCEESTSLGTWVSIYFLIKWGSQQGLEPTTSWLLWQVSSSLYRLRHQSCLNCATNPAYCAISPA